MYIYLLYIVPMKSTGRRWEECVCLNIYYHIHVMSDIHIRIHIYIYEYTYIYKYIVCKRNRPTERGMYVHINLLQYIYRAYEGHRVL
jgi:hypothetical protein